jgi:hypothetical protein
MLTRVIEAVSGEKNRRSTYFFLGNLRVSDIILGLTGFPNDNFYL